MPKFLKAILVILTFILIGVLFVYGYKLGYRIDLDEKNIVNLNQLDSSFIKPITLYENGNTLNDVVTMYTECSYKEKGIVYKKSKVQKKIKPKESDIENAVEHFLATYPRKEETKASLLDAYTYVDGTVGTDIDTQTLCKYIKDNIVEQDTFDVSLFYLPSKYSDYNQSLRELTNKVNKFYIQYPNAVLTAKDCEFTLSGNSISVNEVAIKKRVSEIVNKLDTIGEVTYFFNYVDNDWFGTYPAKSVNYGDIVDTAYEEEFALEKARALESVPVHEVKYKQKAQSISGNYIDVNISTQKLYVIRDNVITLSSNVVTGRANGRDTPTGVFVILEKMTNKTLRGPGYASFVNRWMRLTWDGVGLHDATWRSQFGGDIYKTDGSHGCINLPKSFAYELYDLVKVGDIVVIHT